jgi:hypothetical protein
MKFKSFKIFKLRSITKLKLVRLSPLKLHPQESQVAVVVPGGGGRPPRLCAPWDRTCSGEGARIRRGAGAPEYAPCCAAAGPGGTPGASRSN